MSGIAGYSHRTWVCPFFKRDEKQAIHCEAGVVRFPEREALCAFADGCCAGDWAACSVARVLTEYWERRE